MDNQNQAKLGQNKEAVVGKGKMSPLIIGGIVVVVLLVGYGVMTAGKSNTTDQTKDAEQINEEPLDESDVINEESSSNAENTPAGDTADVMTQAITIEGGSFYFKPNEIRVKKGEKVKIILNSMDAMHDFVIDEFNVKSEQIKGGSSTQVEFTPDQTGTFEFYCSVGQHRQNGMKGNLIVE